MKKILYIDMDNVLVDFKSGIAKTAVELQEKYKENLDDVPHIFSKMDPMPGAIDAFNELSELYDTYILSTAPWHNQTAWSDKLDWVKNYIGKSAYKRLILTHHKNLNKGDFLVDDRRKNGVDSFDGMHIHFGTQMFPNWQSVVDFLKSKL